MPVAQTMTEPSLKQQDLVWPRSPALGQSSPPSSSASRRRRAPPTYRPPQHTVHINIGSVEIPRCLPQVRNMGTQTDDSAIAGIQAEDKKWHNRALRFSKEWIWPVVRFVWSTLLFLIGRIGFGFRLN